MKTVVVLAALAALATSARAQDPAEDWDLATDPAQNLTVASLAFDGGAIVAVRCKAGAFDVLVAGLPPASGDQRTVVTEMGGLGGERQVWRTQPGARFISTDSARVARLLRAGGEFAIRLEPDGPDDRPRRYPFPTPASPAAIDQVLSACGKPLSNDRDLIPRADVQWAQRPIPAFPAAAIERNIDEGGVEVSCLVDPANRLTDCRVETEAPQDAGFGASALAAAQAGRLQPPEGPVPAGPRAVQFTVAFHRPASS